MNVLAIQDWPFTAAGWLLMALGALLLAWSLLWDRPRGRKRCPKCWYDMSVATSLVCPECGRDARRARRLLKTRRRWRWAMVAVALLLAAYPISVVPDVRRDGVWAGVPRWALILAASEIRAPQRGKPLGWRYSLWKQVDKRILRVAPYADHLRWWERPLLKPAALRALAVADVDAQSIGASLLVATRKNAVEIAPEASRGLVAIVATVNAHANVQSYAGAALTTTDAATYTSQLVFQRGLGYRWEITNPANPAEHRILWANEDVAKAWDRTRGASIEASPWTHLAQMSDNAPHVAPGPLPLLVYMLPRFRIDVHYLYEPTWVALEDIDGVLCDHLVSSDKHETHVWIERDTHLIKRVTYTDPARRGTTTFRGKFNVPIDDRLLDFDPYQPDNTPLMRGELDLPSSDNTP